MNLKILLQEKKLIKKFLNKNFFINLLLIIIFTIITIYSTGKIKIDSNITSLFPPDEKLKLALNINQNSPNSKKVILYISSENEEKLLDYIQYIDEEIKKSGNELTPSILTTEQILQLYEYIELNSLLLYPYEGKKNPFTFDEINKRISKKYELIANTPFFDFSNSFFYDPLMFAPEIISNLKEISKGEYLPKYGGIISNDGKSYIKILNVNFKPDDYFNGLKLKKLDDNIKKFAKKNKIEAFLFCSHLYFLESRDRITFELSIIFALTSVCVFLIFYIFFKKLTLIIYSVMPILGGYSLTLLFLSFFMREFSGIAFAFGATIMGISIDYIIHYFAKRELYSSLSELRQKISSSLILGVITTIAGFIFLLISRTRTLVQISIFGSISIFLIFLISFFVLQTLVPPEKRNNSFLHFKIPFLNNKYLFLLWLLITFLIVSLLPFMKFEDNVMNLDMEHKELDRRKKLIMNIFKESTDNIFLLFTGKDREEILSKSLNATLLINKKTDGKINLFSPAFFNPPLKVLQLRKDFIKKNFNKNEFIKVIYNSEFSPDAFNEWLNTIEKIEKFTLSPLPNDLKEILFDSYFINIDGKEYLILHIYDRAEAKIIQKILEENNIDFYLTDIVEDIKDKLVSFEKKALFLLSLSLVLIFLILIFYFKNFIFSFTAILPAFVGLLTCIVSSIFMKNGFNLMHFVVAVLVLGIGVDYGIFVTIAYKNKFTQGELERTFQSILICALTTISSFGVLGLSANYSISSIGKSMFFSMSMSLFTTFYCLPYILQNLKEKIGKNE